MGKELIGVINAPNQGTLDNAQLTGMLDTHINDATPHPAYDDIQSLTGLFENGIA
jgi:hypothetical protein